jgi:predicted DNA-binding protein with PD1-like motif
MLIKEKKNIIFLRLFPNEDVNKQIKSACKIHEVKTAVIISGIGQLKNVQLGYFKEKGSYTKEIFNKPLEILSLNGNICKEDGDYTIHMHAVLGDEKKNALGGHFIEGIVSVTAEIVLLNVDINATRKIDDQTGLKMLHLK